MDDKEKLLNEALMRLKKNAVIMAKVEEALQLIATPMRPDGSWNRDREACRQLAQDALNGK